MKNSQMKHFIFILACTFLLVSCGSKEPTASLNEDKKSTTSETKSSTENNDNSQSTPTSETSIASETKEENQEVIDEEVIVENEPEEIEEELIEEQVEENEQNVSVSTGQPRSNSSSSDEEEKDFLVNNSKDSSGEVFSNSPSPTSETIVDNKFFFDHFSGKCMDDNKEVGFNIGSLHECGDLRGDNISQVSFLNKGLFGLRLEQAQLIDVELLIPELASQEVVVDGKTLFPDSISLPHTSFFLGHANAFRGLKTDEASFYEKYLELRKKKSVLKKEYKKIPKKNKEERATKLEELKLVNAEMAKAHKDKKLSLNKSRRQQSFIKKSYSRASKEDGFKEASIINEKHLTFLEDESIDIKASNQFFKTDKKFTISLWFKTDQQQDGKTIISFKKDESNNPALSLSLSNNSLIMNVHNGDSLQEIEFEYDYSNSKWHHLVLTKKKTTIIGYLNRKPVLKYKGKFSGFGSSPVTLGSFAGDVDELSIWQTNFSKSHIKRLYNKGVPGNVLYHNMITSLIHWWRFGDHERDTATSYFDNVAKETVNRMPASQ